MLVRLAIIVILSVVLWLVTKRRSSFYRASKPGAWSDERIPFWNEAIKEVTGKASKADAVARITQVRDAKPTKTVGRWVFDRALKYANDPANTDVPKILAAFNKRLQEIKDIRTSELSDYYEKTFRRAHPKRKGHRKHMPGWYDRRIEEWKKAIAVVTPATSKQDAIDKISAARDSKAPEKAEGIVFTKAVRWARSKGFPTVPQIIGHYNKIVAKLEKAKNDRLTSWLKSSTIRRRIFQEHIDDAKKYASVADFVAAYQKKVNDLMAKTTTAATATPTAPPAPPAPPAMGTSTFQGEENIPNALRIQMYQKAISDIQSAGSIDAFVKARESAMGVLKKAGQAVSKAARNKRRSKWASQKVGGNYYFYFNSMK